MAVGMEDIQIILAISIPLVTILIIPLVIYFHRNGVSFERLKLQIENLCHCVAKSEKDRDEIEALKRENERMEGRCKSLERRVSVLESNMMRRGGYRNVRGDDGGDEN